jgi:integrase
VCEAVPFDSRKALAPVGSELEAQPQGRRHDHGFRSMASSLLHEHGWNHQVIERQLGHAERNAVSAAYDFAEHLPERRKMMQACADYLDGLKTSANVIPLFKRGY